MGAWRYFPYVSLLVPNSEYNSYHGTWDMLFRSAYILNQESLPTSYKSFLNKHGAKDPLILKGVREIASGLPLTNLEAIETFTSPMVLMLN
ncbi:UNVERIFIED_CONTAM: hypothetical protein Slati_2493300 [Sesamum latifolium]|uniref:Uncharacterized protein n=1 Tax=Sesamum latifolium TaxID=2727402 RepID=A0AAW2WFE4_9LAMI